jgi:hypothetical protein
MSLLPFCQWLAETSGSIALHESLFMYPLVESTHVLMLCLFLGMAIMFDLRLLGLTLTRVPITEIKRRLGPWMIAGFVVMVITGGLLFYAIPVRSYQSVWFRGKVIADPGRSERVRVPHRDRPQGRRMGSRPRAAAGCAPSRRNLACALGDYRRRRADDCLQLVRLRQAASDPRGQRPCRLRRAAGGRRAMNLSMLNLLPFIDWVASSPLSKAISTSTWAFAVIESIHLLALSVIGGAVLIVDLKLLGYGIRVQTLAEVARDAQKWFIGSWTVMIVTGLLLFWSEPQKLYYSTPFAVKMTCLLLGTIFALTVRRRVALAGEGRVSPLVMKLVAIVSLSLWFGVGAGGRWIGFSG